MPLHRSAGRSRPRVHRRARVSGWTLLLAALTASTASAAFRLALEPANLVSFGGFEDSALSLRLPPGPAAPLVAGGWAALAGEPAEVSVVREAYEGRAAVQVAAAAGATAALLQDLPVGTRAFRLEIAVRRLRGRQSVALMGSWQRSWPSVDPPLLSLQLGSRVSLRVGQRRWRIAGEQPRGAWIELAVEVDPREQVVRVFRGGALVATVPALLSEPPRTLVIGSDGVRAGVFRYDTVRLFRLAELELAALRAAAETNLAPQEHAAVERRLESAALALARGAPALAVPELRAAARRLRTSTGDDGATRRLLAGTQRLLRLLELS